MVERFERFSFVISEISRYWHKITAVEMEKYDLKGPHSVYLLALYRSPKGLTAQQICELCGKDKSDVSRMMSILEEKGLVKKEGVHQTLYRGVFKLTESGGAAAKFVQERASLAVDIAGRDLTEENRAVLYDALANIAANLRMISQVGLPEQDDQS